MSKPLLLWNLNHFWLSYDKFWKKSRKISSKANLRPNETFFDSNCPNSVKNGSNSKILVPEPNYSLFNVRKNLQCYVTKRLLYANIFSAFWLSHGHSLNPPTIISASCDNIYFTFMVIIDCRLFFRGNTLKNLPKIGPILLFETLKSEISLLELQEQI